MTTHTTANLPTKTFESSTVIKGITPADLMRFHEAPDAFSILTPPPIFIQFHRRDLPTITGGVVEFTMWIGPIPVRWHAQHHPGPTTTSFIDQQVSGPMAYWRHQHIFEAVPGGAKLTDRVTLAHPPGLKGIFTRLMFDGLPLRMFFFYRHLRTRLALS